MCQGYETKKDIDQYAMHLLDIEIKKTDIIGEN
jgi:hypothetical protein